MTVPVCAKKGSYKVELVAGQKYWWCTCGLSATQPFCDGAHKGTGMKSHMFVVEETKVYSLCGCKAMQEEAKPFCDGSHKML